MIAIFSYIGSLSLAVILTLTLYFGLLKIKLI